MCFSRTTSSFRVPNLGCSQNVRAEVAAQLVRGPEVDTTSQERCQFPLHGSHGQVPRPYAGTELDQDIDIAVGPKVVPKNRAEQTQLPKAVLLAKGLQSRLIDVDPCHGPILAPEGLLSAFGRSRGPAITFCLDFTAPESYILRRRFNMDDEVRQEDEQTPGETTTAEPSDQELEQVAGGKGKGKPEPGRLNFEHYFDKVS